jgi:AraC-like DNA-binding protein
VNLIRGINTSLPSAVGNEIKYIENATLHAFKENIQIKQQIEERKPLLINITLRYLLRGFGLENIDTTEILHSFDIIFRFAQNKVIVIKACESSEITVQTRIRNSMIAELKLAELVKEILPKEFSYYIVKVEWDEIALIINSDIADDKLNRIITEVVLTYKRLLANESEMFINIGIGSVYQEFTGISKSYEEAIIALQYCIYSGLNSVCEYNEIRSYSQKYYYPLDMESRLMNSIRSGDILNTKTILNRLFEENFKKRKLSLDMTKCLYFDIMSTVIKLINELSESDSEVSSIVNNQLNVLVSCKTADDLYRVTENLVSAVCLRIENNKKSHNAKLKMIICEYIEANYSNSDLSISMIADRFGISPNYLSFYFREQTAENISDYISRRRIDEAKRLLRDEKISISDVSEKVGYLSVSVFVRAFKRIEGVTPGKYRNSQLKLPE